jgi:hypothetical protein
MVTGTRNFKQNIRYSFNILTLRRKRHFLKNVHNIMMLIKMSSYNLSRVNYENRFFFREGCLRSRFKIQRTYCKLFLGNC